MSTKLLSTNKVESLTEEDFRFLYNELRKSSVIWAGRKEILRDARKKVFVRRAKNGSPVYKYQWQCAKCSKWFKNEKAMEVDHIVEIGGVSEFRKDILEGILKMFPRPVGDHLQVLCSPCHLRKTNQYNSARSKWTRKKS